MGRCLSFVNSLYLLQLFTGASVRSCLFWRKRPLPIHLFCQASYSLLRLSKRTLGPLQARADARARSSFHLISPQPLTPSPVGKWDSVCMYVMIYSASLYLSFVLKFCFCKLLCPKVLPMGEDLGGAVSGCSFKANPKII